MLYDGTGAGNLTYSAFMLPNVICLGYSTGKIVFIESDKLESLKDSYRPAELVLESSEPDSDGQ